MSLRRLLLRQAARGGRSAGGVELFFERADVGFDEFAQLGNFGGELIGGDLVLLLGRFGGPPGGVAGGGSSRLDPLLTRSRRAFVWRAGRDRR